MGEANPVPLPLIFFPYHHLPYCPLFVIIANFRLGNWGFFVFYVAAISCNRALKVSKIISVGYVHTRILITSQYKLSRMLKIEIMINDFWFSPSLFLTVCEIIFW